MAAAQPIVQVEEAECGVYINTYGFIIYEEEKIKFLLCSKAIATSFSWEKTTVKAIPNGRGELGSLSRPTGKG